MIIKGNDMIVQRGETFTIDRSIVNNDGSPFVVSSAYNNPYLLLTVSSTKYNQQNRYTVNWWLNLNEMYDENGNLIKLPRFNSTRIKTIPNVQDTVNFDDPPLEYLYYDKSENRYVYFEDDIYTFKEYDFRFIHHFIHNITKDWIEQNYVYSIRLVSGEDTLTYLRYLYKSLFDKDADLKLTAEQLYNLINDEKEGILDDLIYTRPIMKFDVVQDIVTGKITVMSDLNGGLK